MILVRSSTKMDVVTVHNVDGGKMKYQYRHPTSSVFEVHTHYREAFLDIKIVNSTFDGPRSQYVGPPSEQQATT